MRLDPDQFDDDDDDQQRFEKIRPGRDGLMPVRGAGSSIRGQQRELATRNPRRRPRRPNGIHRRRIRKFD